MNSIRRYIPHAKWLLSIPCVVNSLCGKIEEEEKRAFRAFFPILSPFFVNLYVHRINQRTKRLKTELSLKFMPGSVYCRLEVGSFTFFFLSFSCYQTV